MDSREALTELIFKVIGETFASKGAPAPPLSPETRVDASLGLDSLDWAAVVVRLETEVGVDPFARGIERELRTIGDLVDLYGSTTG